MISIDTGTRRLTRVGAAILLTAITGPVVAGPIVVRAVGPIAASYKPGQKLGDSATLVLKAGDQVTVLDAQGTRSFSGPGNFRFDQPSAAAAAPTAFAELLQQKPERRARIGAVRGSAGEMTGPPMPPGVWAIDSGASGTVCAIDTAKLSLWRAEPMAAGAFTVTRVAGGKSAPLAFAAGQAIASWPADLAAGTGGQFRITGGAKPAALTLKVLPKPPTAVDDLGAALLDMGCQSQFERLTMVTKRPDSAAM
ncbi:MAG: hypothetical protein H7268_15420 [Sandarakinorhabdus sp.]|nr:hypothetical protein [Sandarakinorhabdus sp.]